MGNLELWELQKILGTVKSPLLGNFMFRGHDTQIGSCWHKRVVWVCGAVWGNAASSQIAAPAGLGTCPPLCPRARAVSPELQDLLEPEDGL